MALSITPDAVALIQARGRSVHLELPAAIVTACCAQSFQERPTVRLGPPPPGDRGLYVARELDGVTVFLPPEVEQHQRDLKLVVASFLGLRRLAIEGWWPV